MQVHRPEFAGIQTRAVTVQGVGDGKAMVLDGHGNQFEVRLGMRPKGSGEPAAGEKWILVKRMSMWSFDSMIVLPETPTISGDRAGLHPVMAQMLAAMSQHGLVIDTTTGSDTIDLDDTTDPSGLSGAMAEPAIPDLDNAPTNEDIALDVPTVSTGHERSTTSGRDADDGGPRTASQKRTEEIPGNTTDTTMPLSVVTYMQGNAIGPQRTRSDLVRLSKTRADIVAIQGADPTDRTAIYNSWDDWSIYRPSGHAATNMLAWRTETFEVLEEFTHHYGAGAVDRYVNGVRLWHLGSQVHLTVLSTQLEPWAAFAGAFTKTAEHAASVTAFKAQMAELLTVVQTYQAKGPIFVCGNFNVDFKRDERFRNHGLPYVSMKGLGLSANWADLGLSTGGPVAEDTYYDQIYLGARQKVVQIEGQRVLRGYYGPHRPVMATYRLKRR